ncbi:uncharacterized protein L969DRAFT_87342 [Mixia osmundae IAM 14324]|uniref:Uncharacterized protein n=1 Tax=Mixia osmundae (strain CBS 9802 / IAM 14324 / JCM 22182 / KY 12970) TaxID=764103 RepID=G7E3I7_MIXOS|nr:uncharacterized protein L969DRAFT_87342 [Mixia osmundae IAM 14324]KEI39383.1 hypothetical protein L969DRAFT_87342 [Mixia osmundae IAM 14324]GAA97397.1 hypothetical protein E5Q_04075 [Mixia osmundae IAM 14324]
MLRSRLASQRLVSRSQCLGASLVQQSRRRASTSVAHPEEHIEPSSGRSEDFSAPIWRYTALAAVGGFLWYHYSLRFSPALNEDDREPGEIYEDERKPFISRWLAYHSPDASQDVKTKSVARLAWIMNESDQQILLQSARRPRMRAIRYPAAFEQASPNGLIVGNQVDMTGIKFRPEHAVFDQAKHKEDLSVDDEGEQEQDDE